MEDINPGNKKNKIVSPSPVGCQTQRFMTIVPLKGTQILHVLALQGVLQTLRTTKNLFSHKVTSSRLSEWQAGDTAF